MRMRLIAKVKVRVRVGVRVGVRLPLATAPADALANGARQIYKTRSTAEMMAAAPRYFAPAATESKLVWLITRAGDELQSSR
jgi:hypothetical protein